MTAQVAAGLMQKVRATHTGSAWSAAVDAVIAARAAGVLAQRRHRPDLAATAEAVGAEMAGIDPLGPSAPDSADLRPDQVRAAVGRLRTVVAELGANVG